MVISNKLILRRRKFCNRSREILGQSAGTEKVAIVACMRKMITILNTMVKNGEEWNEKLA